MTNLQFAVSVAIPYGPFFALVIYQLAKLRQAKLESRAFRAETKKLKPGATS